MADEKFLPALLRAHRRAPAATTTATSAAALGGEGSDRSRGRVEERLQEEEAQGITADSGGGDARDETSVSPAAPVGSGKVTGLEHPAYSARVKKETSADLGDDGCSGVENDAAEEGGVATESLPVVRRGSGSSDGGGNGGGEGGGGDIEGEGPGAPDTDGIAGAGSLEDKVTAPPRRSQQEHPGVADDGQEGQGWRDGEDNGLQHDTEDAHGELHFAVTEPGSGSSSDETDLAEESRDASGANEPAADAAQPEAAQSKAAQSAASTSPSLDRPSSETTAAREAACEPYPSEGSSHGEEVPPQAKETPVSDGGDDHHPDGTASSPPKEDEGRPPQAEEGHAGGPDGAAAATGDDRDDEDGGSSAGSNDGGGAPGLGAASGGDDATVDVTASARGMPEANSSVRPLLVEEEKPLRERAASWAWVVPSWLVSAGGKHH